TLATADRDFALVVNPTDLALAIADAQAEAAHDLAMAEQHWLAALKAAGDNQHEVKYPGGGSTLFPYALAVGGTPNANPLVPAVSQSAPAVPATRQPTNSVDRFQDAAQLAGEML